MSLKDVPLLELVQEIQSRTDEAESLEIVRARVVALEEENMGLREDLAARDRRVEELEAEVSGLELQNHRDVPDNFLDVVKIAYRADPSRVEYLLNMVPKWRNVVGHFAASLWLERSRTANS